MTTPLRLSIQIDADGTAAIRGIRQVDDQIEDLGEETRRTEREVNQLSSRLGALAGTIVGGLALDGLVDEFMRVNVESGRLHATLQTVTGSADAAAGVWGTLTELAAQTPYELSQAVEAFIALKSRGLDPGIESLRSYGNTASAFGVDLTDMIEAVADATTGEFDGLKAFGIQARSQGDLVSLTFKGMTTVVKQESGAIQDYLLALGKTEFASGMDLQSKQLGGSLSNLGDTWDDLMRALGENGGVTAAKAAIAGLAWTIDQFRRGVEAAGSAWEGGPFWAPEATAGADRISETIGKRSALMAEYISIQAKLNTLSAAGSGDFESTRQANTLSAQLLDTAQAVGYLDSEIAQLQRETAAGAKAMQVAATDTGDLGGKTDELTDAERRRQEQLDKTADEQQRWLGLASHVLDLTGSQRETMAALLPSIDAVAEAYGYSRERIAALVLQQTGLNAVSAQTGAALELVADKGGALGVAIGDGFEPLLYGAGELESALKAKLADGLDAAGRAAQQWGKDQAEAAKLSAEALEDARQKVAGLVGQYLPAKAAAEELTAAMVAMSAAGEKLSDSDRSTIITGLKNDQIEAAIGLAESYDTAWAAAQRIEITQSELNTLLQAGQMVAAEYGREMEIAALTAEGSTSALAAYFADVKREYEGVKGLVSDVGDTIKDSLADALAQGKLDMEDLLTSLRNKLAQFAVDTVWDAIGTALSKSLSGAGSSTSGLGGLLGTFVSGLFGGGTKAATGLAYVTGPGTTTSDSVPAWLSVGEGIVSARANRSNPGVVAAMNRGEVVGRYAAGTDFVGGSALAGSAASGARPVNLTIESHGVSIETQRLSEDDIRLIARQEAGAAVRTQAPGVVASSIRNPNGAVSKALATSTTASRRR